MKARKFRFIGFNFYESAQIVKLDFCGLVIYMASGQCRTLFGYSWVEYQK